MQYAIVIRFTVNIVWWEKIKSCHFQLTTQTQAIIDQSKKSFAEAFLDKLHAYASASAETVGESEIKQSKRRKLAC